MCNLSIRFNKVYACRCVQVSLSYESSYEDCFWIIIVVFEIGFNCVSLDGYTRLTSESQKAVYLHVLPKCWDQRFILHTYWEKTYPTTAFENDSFLCVWVLCLNLWLYTTCAWCLHRPEGVRALLFSRVIDTTCHVVLGLKKLGHLEEQPVLSDVRVFL